MGPKAPREANKETNIEKMTPGVKKRCKAIVQVLVFQSVRD